MTDVPICAGLFIGLGVITIAVGAAVVIQWLLDAVGSLGNITADVDEDNP